MLQRSSDEHAIAKATHLASYIVELTHALEHGVLQRVANSPGFANPRQGLAWERFVPDPLLRFGAFMP